MYQKGNILANRFELIKRLGAGGMGEVWLARDRVMDNEEIAIKFVRNELAGDTRAINDLKREVRNARKLTDRSIVRINELMIDGGNYYITMEYIRGVDLNSRLAQYQEKGRNFGPDEALEVARSVCPALDYAHSQKVLHLDIKPSNIIATEEGGYKVMDFGIARSAQESMTRISRAPGYSMGYGSPEQLMGKELDRRTDVYSVAATLYDLLAGHTPFHRGDVFNQTVHKDPEPIPGIPDYLNDVILGALSKDCEDRPKTAGELLEQLEKGKKGGKLSRKKPKPKPEPKPEPQPQPTVISERGVKPIIIEDKDEYEEEDGALGFISRLPRKLVIGVGGGLIAILLVILFFVLFGPNLGGGGGDRPGEGDIVKVPNVVGMEYEMAEGMLSDKGFGTTRTSGYDVDVGEGKVMEMNPAAGTELDFGKTVRLKVCDPNAAIVPDLGGYTSEEAEARIKEEGYRVGEVSEEYSSTAEAGTVMSSRPAGFSNQRPGTEIDYTVSKGKKPASTGGGESSGGSANKVCSQCGAVNPRNAKICKGCGNAF